MTTSPTATPDQVAREIAERIVRKWRKAPAVGEEMKVKDITAALEARDAEIERLKAELDEARREILIYLETRIPAALEATAKAAREVERKRWMKIVDVCTCGSGPEFRSINMRYHAPTCSKNLVPLAIAAEPEQK